MQIGGQTNSKMRTTRDVKMFASNKSNLTSSFVINRNPQRFSSASSNFLSSSLKLNHDHSRSLAKRYSSRIKATLVEETHSSSSEEVAKFTFDENDDVVMNLSDKTQINIENLKDADYSTFKKIDENIVIDPSLKIGTGDDELVDNIVAGAKSSLGGIGAIIPDQMVSSTLKGAKVSNLQQKKEKKVETRNYVSKTRDEVQSKLLDDEGLPLVYSQEGIQQFWSGKSGELVGRWTEFLGLSSPFLLKVLTNLVTNNYEEKEQEIVRDFRVILEKLGPTYVKMG